MPATDAVMMSNWFPRQSDVVSRPGYSEHCATGIGATLQQLVPYNYAGTRKLLACGGGAIHEVLDGVTEELTTGKTNSEWSYDILNGTLMLANGADTVQVYNGTTLADGTWTGVTQSTLNFAKVHKSRFYFVKKDTTSMWYGGTAAVAGALTEFNFANVHSVKGKLMMLATLTGDGGDGGSDDLFVAIFSGGTVIAYSGSDPSDATNWTLVGKYQIGEPLSRFGILESDADIYILTSRGYEQLGKMIRSGLTATESKLISSKIQLAVKGEISAIGVSDNWRLSIHPLGQMMIVTVPRTGDARHQHVRNINTGAWCRFDAIMSFCWALIGTEIYFGGANGVVYQFDDGSLTDNGATIRLDAQQAWNFLGNPGYNKQIVAVKPFFKTDIYPAVGIATGVDFQQINIGTFGSAETGDYAIWDEAVWDEDTWSPENVSFARWYHRPCIGDAIGLRVSADITLAEVRWNMTRVLALVGGLL